MVKGKLLRRRVFIREKDFIDTLHNEAIKCGYTRAEWEPITADELAKEATWLALRTGLDLESKFFSTRELRLDSNQLYEMLMSDGESISRRYMYYIQNSKQLWNPNYRHWAWNWDHGQVRLRYRSNTPWGNLGVATLERDY